MDWLSYTFLAARMPRNPLRYGLDPPPPGAAACTAAAASVQRRCELLAAEAVEQLLRCGLVAQDPPPPPAITATAATAGDAGAGRDGGDEGALLGPTELGRIAR